MTELRFEKKIIKGAHMNGASDLPAMRNARGGKFKTKLDEDDGLFIGYGMVPNMMPYTMQDKYDRAEDTLTWDVAVLENEHLKATFTPHLGGRMWSLFDKDKGENLITDNPVFRPGNLAGRDAWFCGGVEYNIGVRAHCVFTCDNLFVSRTEMADGTPVLRMYEYERIRNCTYQMDFFLPADSKFLFARMRIVNPNEDVVPMYWWSNQAVPEREGYRVVVPAVESFSNAYISETERGMGKVPIPNAHGFDATYPTNHPIAIDHFFNIPETSRKFETQLSPEGYGYIHASTDRLQGRKLFVWGQSTGGYRWQQSLTSEDGEFYQEMQAGLAHTQMECLPMPPKTAWEWVEAYGAMHADGSKIFGDWETAIEEVRSKLDVALPLEKLNRLLAEGKADFATKKGESIKHASGWGALENYRRAKAGKQPISEHLDFGEMGEEQMVWKHLLDYGYMPDVCPCEAPSSYMVQNEWFDMLKKAAAGPDAANWLTWFHLGLNWYYREDFERARQCIDKSLSLKQSVWALYALANIERVEGKLQLAASIMSRAAGMRPQDISLAKESLKTCIEAKDYTLLLATFDKLNADVQQIPMVKFLRASALAHTGNWDAAEAILLENGGIVVPDLREGENSLTELYIYIQIERAKKAGKELSPDDVELPESIDFRMNVKRDRKAKA
nr:DUF5107 domain-containing protein [bacterium]